MSLLKRQAGAIEMTDVLSSFWGSDPGSGFLRSDSSLTVPGAYRKRRLLRKKMRTEFVTTSKLMAQLREKGIEDCRRVKSACMETDGRISVMKM